MSESPSSKPLPYQAIGVACCIIGFMWIVIAESRGDQRIGVNVPIAMMWTCIGLAIVMVGRNKSKKSDSNINPPV